MEGPSLTLLGEELQPFLGMKVLKVTGNTKQRKEFLLGRKLDIIETWGKVLFLVFTQANKRPIVTKTHFLMFGSYRINEPKPKRDPRLQLDFKNGTLYLYSCSLQFEGEKYRDAVDHGVDIMSEQWNLKHVLRKMKEKKDSLLCDLFLDQQVFSGSGNIIKNEVLFNIRCHPLTPLSKVPETDWPKLARAVRSYGADFYQWKKRFELRQHWQVYRKSSCPDCGTKIVREKTGKWERRSFYCPHCQVLRTRKKAIHVFRVIPLGAALLREERLDH